MEHDDDAPLGRLMSRRDALALIALGGAATVLGCRPGERAASGGASRAAPRASTVPSCVARPEQTQGPYYVDEELNRSDLRMDPTTGVERPGAPLALRFGVSRIRGGRCAPLEGARVDVWHCDALGAYSDVRDPDFDTRGRKFLRGYQLTDAAGHARFTTIYPGWYVGRTVHVHFKIRTSPAEARGHGFTSQLYFDDALTDRVHARPPYAQKGARHVRNEDDGIFRHGGDQLTLAVAEVGSGYAANFDIGLQI
jgi:protocatechuate 3,4-dioxygenase beta subunit